MTSPQLDATKVISRRTLLCKVTPEDIDAMLDAYDSGMCDLSTANCLSRSVARAVGAREPVPLIRHSPEHAYWVFEDYRLPVAPDLLEWLDAAETGRRSESIQFELVLPDCCQVSEAIAIQEVELSLAS